MLKKGFEIHKIQIILTYIDWNFIFLQNIIKNLF